uniref:Cystatin B n=1 Tax=Molossus molossus TaxID=27622 RepID=A0A7J8HYC1_MOLMO|nr:cystatin B [Molossus molossus]
MMCGGCSDTRPATAEVQAITDKVKAQLEEKENKKYSTFKAVEFQTQVVAGTNYFIKVGVSYTAAHADVGSGARRCQDRGP